LTVRGKPELEYESYEFQKTIITIDNEGNLEETVSLEEKIKISKNWRQYCAGNKPEDGYLSKGATKFAFLVCHFSILPFNDNKDVSQGPV
jgi:hypothetical protein